MTIVIKNISEEQVKDLEWLFDSKVTRLPPHGDLIDKGVLKISLLGEEYGTNFPTVFNQIIKVVNSVPVVVESEE